MLTDIGSYIAATAALGTAAFAIVDGSKAFRGGVSNRGFAGITATVRSLIPAATARSAPPLANILATLRANWINGTPLADQKAIAKTLVKLRLDPGSAGAMAATTGVDAAVLASIADKIHEGASLSQSETDVFGRFDLIVTTLLDEAYQLADQQYRNTAKVAAVGVSLVLAFFGGWVEFADGFAAYWFSADMGAALLTGLIATPVAPVAKDLASALASASSAMRTLRG